MSIILESQETWPIELIKFLKDKSVQLMEYAQYEENYIKRGCNSEDDISYRWEQNPWLWEQEQAIEKISILLESTTLRGWHCTRLTKSEIEHITKNGMQLPNLKMLEDRISRLQAEGKIYDRIAKEIKNKNYADETSRKDKIWFCFFSPRLAHQSGLEKFFRYWGGEALYRAHQEDLETKNILMNIGQPCLIEVDVPISALGQRTCLAEKIIRRYLVNHGLKTGECIDHEDWSKKPISAHNISRFIFYNDPEFIKLVGCDQWSPQL